VVAGHPPRPGTPLADPDPPARRARRAVVGEPGRLLVDHQGGPARRVGHVRGLRRRHRLRRRGRPPPPAGPDVGRDPRLGGHRGRVRLHRRRGDQLGPADLPLRRPLRAGGRQQPARGQHPQPGGPARPRRGLHRPRPHRGSRGPLGRAPHPAPARPAVAVRPPGPVRPVVPLRRRLLHLVRLHRRDHPAHRGMGLLAEPDRAAAGDRGDVTGDRPRPVRLERPRPGQGRPDRGAADGAPRRRQRNHEHPLPPG
jgi:hypothetical protein